MGTGGGLWDPGDLWSAARANQKEVFVGTGTAIAAISPTYAGMRAYATDTSGGFTVDTLYIRNAANAAWVTYLSVASSLSESAETTLVGATATVDFTAVSGTRYYSYLTIPNTYQVYEIVGIEWNNGATAAGNVICGVDLVDSVTAPSASMPLLTIGEEVAATGVNAVQRVSVLSSNLVRASSLVGAWVMSNNATQTFKEQTGLATKSRSKVIPGGYSTNIYALDSTALSGSGTNEKYIKLYLRGLF